MGSPLFESERMWKLNNDRPAFQEYMDVLNRYAFFKEQEKWGLVPMKTSKKSVEFRKRGNNLYLSGRHDETASHRKILILYSKAVAYAPNESEELALALSNRSALWLHVNRYDLCLIDVERALRITTSNDLKNKLLIRQTKCLQSNQLNLQHEARSRNELPTFNQSEFISCAADCIKLELNKKFGRHYVATRDINPGEVIISEKSPYVFAPYISRETKPGEVIITEESPNVLGPYVHSRQMYLVCSHCLASAWVAIPCGSCVYAIYCSDICKQKAWSQYHDVECAITSFLMCKGLEKKNLFDYSYLVKMMIIMVRKDGIKPILRDAKKIGNHKVTNIKNLLSNGMVDGESFGFIYRLAKTGDLEPEVDEHVTITLTLLLKFLIQECETSHYQVDCEKLILSMKTILRELKNIQETNFITVNTPGCNCLGERCEENCIGKKGIILAPCSSLINHSCNPNVTLMYTPESGLSTFSLQPIKKGEQIFMSYGPQVSMMTKNERREHLLMSHRFICECEACDGNWSKCFEPTTSKLQKLRAHFPDMSSENYQKIVHAVVEPRVKRHYSRELFDDAMKMVDTAYKNLDRQLAFYFGDPLKLYIEGAFEYFHGEIVNFPETC
ncbi:hypothetical protein QAD02_015489 [Eretmocerus hayati]|uniref:Uncharacterized protein n=1 Tax=Eretmocerus hayati TaxID=131215 RepID=A0ACC2P8S6_9HYME|nr:hypothetical protein QAD02_015489 [Eretmocerus hayati]